MIRRLLPFLLAALVVVVGLVGAQEPSAEPGDPPFRLKKKKRAPDAPAVKQPAKEDKDKTPAPPKDKEPAKEKAKEDPLENEDGPGGEPEEDDKEVLERIGRNIRGVEEKLGNRELGDPTSQQQRDILKDLDSLLRKKQQSEGGGGGGGADQQPQNGEQDQKQKGSSRSQSQAGEKSGMSRSQQRKQQRQQRAKRGQRQRMGQAKSQPGEGQEQPQAKPGGDGNTGTGVGRSRENNKNLNADLYKDVWGHLPESLRAEMNAYSNPSPFLPRYDDLIKKYYRTIAEQGRKKGD